MSDQNQTTVNELKVQLNKLYAAIDPSGGDQKLIDEITSVRNQIDSIEREITFETEKILKFEILNLLEGVGEGFKEANYYAPDRYYSCMRGIKNIRFLDEHQRKVEVKITSPIGKLLPPQVEAAGKSFDISYVMSSHYTGEIDY